MHSVAPNIINQQKFLKNIILISFEYPPRKLSIFCENVFNLANYLMKKAIRVWIVTFDDWRSSIEKEKNIIVNRIPNNIPNNISFFSYVMNLKMAYQSALATIINEEEIDLIHFFDWETLPLLASWGNSFNIPLVYSTNSIQIIRDSNINPYTEGIIEIEKMAMKNFSRIYVDSESLLERIHNDYSIDKKTLRVESFSDKKYYTNIYSEYERLIKLEAAGKKL